MPPGGMGTFSPLLFVVYTLLIAAIILHIIGGFVIITRRLFRSSERPASNHPSRTNRGIWATGFVLVAALAIDGFLVVTSASRTKQSLAQHGWMIEQNKRQKVFVQSTITFSVSSQLDRLAASLEGNTPIDFNDEAQLLSRTIDLTGQLMVESNVSFERTPETRVLSELLTSSSNRSESLQLTVLQILDQYLSMSTNPRALRELCDTSSKGLIPYYNDTGYSGSVRSKAFGIMLSHHALNHSYANLPNIDVRRSLTSEIVNYVLDRRHWDQNHWIDYDSHQLRKCIDALREMPETALPFLDDLKDLLSDLINHTDAIASPEKRDRVWENDLKALMVSVLILGGKDAIQPSQFTPTTADPPAEQVRKGRWVEFARRVSEDIERSPLIPP